MNGGIYVIQDDGQLVELRETAYDSEDLLQGLLAKYPNLLAGDQMDSTNPRRWLLVRREAPVASEAEGSWRWSLDHLFLDQDAIPTLVEVKRSSDTRLRREVVGQMLDYAANAVVFGRLRRFEPSSRQSSKILAVIQKGHSSNSLVLRPIQYNSGRRRRPTFRLARCEWSS